MSEISNYDFESPVDWINRYFPGEDVDGLPSDMEYKHMLHLIAYDICDASRLRKVAKVCELYGVRVEKSVFEADLTDEQFQDFWVELMGIIDENEDMVINYQFCKACVAKTELLGRAVRPHKVVCYFI